MPLYWSGDYNNQPKTTMCKSRSVLSKKKYIYEEKQYGVKISVLGREYYHSVTALSFEHASKLAYQMVIDSLSFEAEEIPKVRNVFKPA